MVPCVYVIMEKDEEQVRRLALESTLTHVHPPLHN